MDILKHILIIPICFFSNISAAAIQCSDLFSKLASVSDTELFEKSLLGPALEGSINVSPEYKEFRQQRGGIDENIFPWSAYFLADPARKSLSSPLTHVEYIRDDLTQIMNQRMKFFDTSYPLQVFFIAHDTQVFFPNSTGTGWRQPFNLTTLNSKGFSELHSSLKVKIGDTEAVYRFAGKSQVIFIGNGNGRMDRNGWDEPFTIAHEIAHTNSFMVSSGDIKQFVFLEEAVADFKALLYTDRPSSLLGPQRNPKSDLILSLDEMFLNRESITPHEAGGVIAKGLWKAWEVIDGSDSVPNYLINHYLSRIVNLFTNPVSPWVENDGKHYRYKKFTEINKAQLQGILNFFGSVSMQWVIERGFPIDVVKGIGKAWEIAGAKGPYRRYRPIEIDPEGIVTLEFFEDRNNSINIPEQWPSIEALIYHLD